ncbi:MAG TPA: TetR/AcrR family transcriptional regulator [Thermomonospora sp.]|nr:TetR/AcrR family transcriptional regulator [Thermomonospora sp.]
MITVQRPERRGAAPARDRILATAAALFYAEGIRAVGVDRIIAEAGVAKATFYHHFPAKDDLVRAYLEDESARHRAAAAGLPRTAPRETLLTIFDIVGEVGCGPGFRGCPFCNAAAEYPDPGHPVRAAVADHRRWFRDLLTALLAAEGHPDPDRTAAMLVVLRDGLATSSHLDDPAEVRALVRDAVTRLLDAGP